MCPSPQLPSHLPAWGILPKNQNLPKMMRVRPEAWKPGGRNEKCHMGLERRATDWRSTPPPHFAGSNLLRALIGEDWILAIDTLSF